MKNHQIIYEKLKEILRTLILSSKCLREQYFKRNYSDFNNIYENILSLLNESYITVIKIEDSNGCNIAIESIKDSFNRIGLLKKSRSYKVIEKLEFELIPLMEDAYLKLYFLTRKINNYKSKDEYKTLFFNNYIEKSVIDNVYKYELSIIVLGYNKLEYTKLCLESLFRYIPEQLNYELILVNHGSTDGTKEYFESISPTKQFDVLKNGGGLLAINRIIEGEFVLTISNDVLITKNSIENMMNCMKSNTNIAWVVPSTPNVSNFQSIDANYNNFQEMYKFAEFNNKKNEYRWEYRTRLCNPIDLKRSKVFFSKDGIEIDKYINTNDIFLFPDDITSVLLRRKGYSMILAKDSYCYHFGSITLKEEIEKVKEANYYAKGIEYFNKQFNIEPWGIGYCYDKNLFNYLDCKSIETVNVLGINCGMGSNPLKIREQIKENSFNFDTKIYNITDDIRYIEDLKGVSDYVEKVDSIIDLINVFYGIKFNYIIFESNVENYVNPELIGLLKKRVSNNGNLCILNYIFEDAIRIKSSTYSNAHWSIYTND